MDWPSCFSRLTFASGGVVRTILSSTPNRIESRACCGSSRHGVSSDTPNALQRLYIMAPSQVSALYRSASRTKQPSRMLRFGSGTSSSGCVSLSTPSPPHVRHALSEFFQFNNPESACRTCGGLGVDKVTHPELLVPDPQRSILGGCFVREAFRYNPDSWDGRMMFSLAATLDFPLDSPWNRLPEKARHAIL